MKLVVKKRKKIRKKVKGLLKEDLLPGVVYGPRRDSINVKIDVNGFVKVFEKMGYVALFDLEIEGEKKGVKALVREIQYNPVTDEIIHVSFLEPDLSKPISAEVPVVTKGKSKAVEEKIGFLVTPFETLEVRCLPEKLPSKLIVDISDLNEIGDSKTIEDLDLPKDVELSADVTKTATLAYIAPPQKEIVEEEKEVVTAEEGEEGEEIEEEEIKEGEEAEEGEMKEGEGLEKAEKEETEKTSEAK